MELADGSPSRVVQRLQQVSKCDFFGGGGAVPATPACPLPAPHKHATHTHTHTTELTSCSQPTTLGDFRPRSASTVQCVCGGGEGSPPRKHPQNHYAKPRPPCPVDCRHGFARMRDQFLRDQFRQRVVGTHKVWAFAGRHAGEVYRLR